jgi:hypothetical protein
MKQLVFSGVPMLPLAGWVAHPTRRPRRCLPGFNYHPVLSFEADALESARHWRWITGDQTNHGRMLRS